MSLDYAKIEPTLTGKQEKDGFVESLSVALPQACGIHCHALRLVVNTSMLYPNHITLIMGRAINEPHNFEFYAWVYNIKLYFIYFMLAAVHVQPPCNL